MIKIFRERVGLRTIRSRRKEGIKQLSGNRGPTEPLLLYCSTLSSSGSNQNVHRRNSKQGSKQNFVRADPWIRLEGAAAGGRGCKSSPKFINVCLLLEAAFPDRPAKIVPAAAAQSIFSLYFAVCFPSASISALETTGFEGDADEALTWALILSLRSPLWPQRPQTRRVSPRARSLTRPSRHCHCSLPQRTIERGQRQHPSHKYHSNNAATKVILKIRLTTLVVVVRPNYDNCPDLENPFCGSARWHLACHCPPHYQRLHCPVGHHPARDGGAEQYFDPALQRDRPTLPILISYHSRRAGQEGQHIPRLGG